jgi:uncharacterized protein
MTLQGKYIRLQQILKDLQKVLIAYSGGVDSTFLLKAAVDTLGKENVLACIAKGPSLPQSQYEQAIKTAKKIGAKIKTIEADELKDPKFTANNSSRCFHCKSHLLIALEHLAKKNGFQAILCGNNLDDEKDFRPGNRAMKIHSACSPLLEAQLTKDDIRRLSRKFNLPTADIPASPCLASRITYGLKITKERLKQVEAAEDYLRTEFGLTEFRVRHHDTIARIEAHPSDFDKITREPARSKIVEKLKSLGFKYVTIDLQGFRSGSLNETLTRKER